MLFAEFKAEVLGGKSLNFYPSKQDNGRFVASFLLNGKSNTVVTRSDYDPTNAEVHVYPNNILADADGVVIDNLWWLSNKPQAEAAFSL